MEAIKQRRNGPTGITKPSSGIPASDRDPDPETDDMAVDDEAKNNAEAATHTHPQGSQDVIVEVDRSQQGGPCNISTKNRKTNPSRASQGNIFRRKHHGSEVLDLHKPWLEIHLAHTLPTNSSGILRLHDGEGLYESSETLLPTRREIWQLAN
ncbi:uncharacterized protein LOC123037420 isoform X3 [Drosophila rhopaloa]|uniref:Uncharacterized protein n=1 Tax=Drosophila rhopaloa TaxID=1041015 RepID=A0ABM5J513_DRORH|nr:uncharacterized protein LOC108044441 isoform X3 [Drosophila rhopaloa]XP_044313900.1 uncharacterized protein LOC123037420 isoform X3 [Drosophila rhopaloa]